MSEAAVDRRVLRLQEPDDVAVALSALAAGETIRLASGDLAVLDDVPAGHKVALRDLPQGAPVHKYGEVIGHAVRPIRAGQHVHVQNLASGRLRGDMA